VTKERSTKSKPPQGSAPPKKRGAGRGKKKGLPGGRQKGRKKPKSLPSRPLPNAQLVGRVFEKRAEKGGTKKGGQKPCPSWKWVRNRPEEENRNAGVNRVSCHQEEKKRKGATVKEQKKGEDGEGRTQKEGGARIEKSENANGTLPSERAVSEREGKNRGGGKRGQGKK